LFSPALPRKPESLATPAVHSPGHTVRVREGGDTARDREGRGRREKKKR
jgi:hypothetical protein